MGKCGLDSADGLLAAGACEVGVEGRFVHSGERDAELAGFSRKDGARELLAGNGLDGAVFSCEAFREERQEVGEADARHEGIAWKMPVEPEEELVEADFAGCGKSVRGPVLDAFVKSLLNGGE